MNQLVSGIAWLTLYFVVIALPLILMLVPPVPTGRGFWLELSVALGFVGLTQIVVQFVLISRFKRFSAPYGIDVILRFHRQIALVAIILILVHPVLIIVDSPSRISLLNPFGGNWASRAAWISTLCLVGIAVTSIFRQQLKLNYERWRLVHWVLGIGALVFALVHVALAGLYMNTWWKYGLWIAPAVLLAGVVFYWRILKPGLFPQNTWRVAEVRDEEGRMITLVVEPVGHEGMRFLPGQFAWITMGGKRFTLQENPFTIKSSAEQTGRVEFGIEPVGDFTNAVKHAEAGTPIRLDGPHGAFSIDRYPAVGYVFIGGGSGITPILCFLRTMADRRDPRPVVAFYADRSPDHFSYRKDFDALEGRLDLDMVYVPDDAPEDWKGESGKVDREMMERHVPRELIHREFFICGPKPMMDALHKQLVQMGVHEDHIHLELFDLV